MDRQETGSSRAPVAAISHDSVGETSRESSEEPPGTGRRHPVWKNVPLEQWEDWRWQMQNAVRTTRQIDELLGLSPAEIPALEQLETAYKLAIPPYYFSLIDPDDPHDPIRLQSVPSAVELAPSGGQELEDPLEEDQDSPVPGLTHRYPDRVLMVTTHVCSMYCRFCTRKRVTMDRSGWDAPSRNDQRMVDYIRQHPEVHDVIVSGGDPLSLPISKLSWLINELAAIDHVGMIRLGTRVPVTLPQRIFDSGLVELLRDAGKIWIQTHFNHPREITPESTRAIRTLVNNGMPVNNHTVLLKGVNDSVPTMRDLMRGLLKIKARPYYLFHCDPVVGAGHFRTTVWKGLEIMEGLRGHVSGLGVPTYVVDGLHGAGKIPVMPNYLISASEDAVVLRNYEGLIFKYAPEHKENPQTETYDSLGVSGLLGGAPKPLIPEGNRRLARRQLRHDLAEAANGCGTNGSSDNGQQAAAPATDSPEPVLLQLLSLGGPEGPTNGNGNVLPGGVPHGNGHAVAVSAASRSKRPRNGQLASKPATRRTPLAGTSPAKPSRPKAARSKAASPVRMSPSRKTAKRPPVT